MRSSTLPNSCLVTFYWSVCGRCGPQYWCLSAPGCRTLSHRLPGKGGLHVQIPSAQSHTVKRRGGGGQSHRLSKIHCISFLRLEGCLRMPVASLDWLLQNSTGGAGAFWSQICSIQDMCLSCINGKSLIDCQEKREVSGTPEERCRYTETHQCRVCALEMGMLRG